jgi:hypothetical protein
MLAHKDKEKNGLGQPTEGGSPFFIAGLFLLFGVVRHNGRRVSFKAHDGISNCWK